MSNLKLPNHDDYPDAAGKHLADATVLEQQGRADGAGYLSGYVVECALKTLLLVEQHPGWGHSLSALSKEALRLGALPGAHTARYQSGVPTAAAVAAGWSETLRYRSEREVSPSDASAWLAEAKAMYEAVIVAMKLDGVL